MSMTWGDVKLATTQKMFAADGTTIPSDKSTTDYIAGMPYAANEALYRIATVGKFITKSVVIAHQPLENLISEEEAYKLTTLNGTTATFTGAAAKCYYFEFTGRGQLTIDVNGTATTLSLNSQGTYTIYQGNITNTDDEEVTLTIEAYGPCAFKNIALYDAVFSDASEIPPFAKQVRYNMKSLVSDFYNMSENQIFYEGGTGCEYLQTTDYYRESDHVLLLPRTKPGSYTVYYHAYPATVSASTDDDYAFPDVDPECVAILPLYMASELYKDDDNGIATIYRNEFETALGNLVDTSTASGKEEFTSKYGWI